MVTIGGAYIQSGIIDNEACSLLVPAFAGPTDYGEIGFAFSRPGTYEVRWQFGSTGVSPVDFAIEQTVEVGVATRADLQFIERLSEPDLLRQLFGEEFFARQTDTVREQMLSPSGADCRALKVIAQLLKATRADEPGDVVGPRRSMENALKWADSLIGLATEFPESSYAPYAAYYAGCCYLAALTEAMEDMTKERGIKDHSMNQEDLQRVTAFGKRSPYYQKAEQALSLAAERCDPYLRPRVHYFQAFLRLCGGGFEEAGELLDRAVEAGGKRGTIQKVVDTLRRDLVQAKERLSRKSRDSD